MFRYPRLIPLTLTTGAAFLLLPACSDGQVENDDTGLSPSNAGGSSPVGSTTGGSASGIPSLPQAGQAPAGGASGGGAGGAKGGSGGGGKGEASAGTAGQGGASSAGSAGATSNAGTSGGSNEPVCDDDDELVCGGACVDPSTSELHCGTCGKACAQGQQCESGTCECSGDLTLCGGACRDTDSDAQNCGGCGKKCAADESCSEGECVGEPGGSVTSCSSITDFGVVSSTIVVKKGQTYDGKCRRYRADPDELGDGSQDEGQQPVFIVEDGGKLINVVLGAPAADGIHTEGDVTLENITWEDIGEDALTIKESGTVILNGGSAKNGADKVFQVNAASTFRISNFKASNAGKFVRQNGGTSFKAQVFIDNCDISNMSESVFRTDSSSSTVSLTNTRYHAIGDSLFIGVSAGNITQSNNTKY